MNKVYSKAGLFIVECLILLLISLCVDLFWVKNDAPRGVMTLLFYFIFMFVLMIIKGTYKNIYDKLFVEKSKYRLILFVVGYYLLWCGFMVSMILILF